MTITTKYRFMQWNGRKDNIQETNRDRFWDRREPYAMEFIKTVAPQVWAGQEWTVNMCNAVMEHFPNMTYAGGVKFGNSPVFWDTRYFVAKEGTLAEWHIPSDQVERYMTLIRLTHRETGWGSWFGSMHLAAGNPETERDEVHLRAVQIKEFVHRTQDWIKAHPHSEDDKPNLIVGGDLNDYQITGGVRKIAYDLAGWKQIRQYPDSRVVGRLPLDHVVGESIDSFNGWHTNTARNGRWIDEIFTSGVELEDAALRRTDKSQLPLHASDHNALSFDMVITAPKAPVV